MRIAVPHPQPIADLLFAIHYLRLVISHWLLAIGYSL
jgi:hypothetical protein